MSINQRVKEWFDIVLKTGVNQTTFVELWGKSKQQISLMANGKGSMGIEIVKLIIDYDKQLSARWLILGEGKMYECDEYISEINEKDEVYSVRKEESKILKEQLKAKDGQIAFLQNQIEKLQEEQ